MFQSCAGDDAITDLVIAFQIPSFKNFKGSITELEPQKYQCTGTVNVLDEKTLEITELPVKTWTQNYKEQLLEPYLYGTEKIKVCIT